MNSETWSTRSGPIAIMGAMAIETSMLLEHQLTSQKQLNRFGLPFHTGKLRGQDVVVVTGGVGTANCAAAAAILIERFQPAALIFTGVAGGLGEAYTGDVVIGSKSLLYGYGELDGNRYEPKETTNPISGESNPLYFSADPILLKAAQQASKQVTLPERSCFEPGYQPKVITGIVATEDIYSIYGQRNEQILEAYGCIAFEMEGAAIAQICHQQQVPCLIVRAISNPANETGAAANVYQQCKEQTANNAQLLVAEIVAILGSSGSYC